MEEHRLKEESSPGGTLSSWYSSSFPCFAHYIVQTGSYLYKVSVWLVATAVASVYAWKALTAEEIKSFLRESWWFVKLIFPLSSSGFFRRHSREDSARRLDNGLAGGNGMGRLLFRHPYSVR